ncbi:MAG TPA: PLxRFG domain-containing protein [Pseudoxanthomonas sp.]
MAGITDPFKPAAGGITDPFRPAARPTPAAASPSPVAKRPERSLGEAVKDTALGVGRGLVNMAGSTSALENLYNPMQSVGRIAPKVSATLLRGLGNDAGADALEGAAAGIPDRQQILQKVGGAIDSNQSEALQQSKQELADTEGFWASAKKTVTDPRLLGNFVAEQVPNLALGGVGTGFAGARAAASAGATALEKALATGVSRAAAQALARRAGQEAGKQAGSRVAIASNTVLETGAATNQAYLDALGQPDEVWQANPEYQRRTAAGEQPEDVKRALALQASARTAAIAAPLSAIAGKVSAPFEADVFTGQLARRPVAIAGGIAREATEEGIQEGGSQLATNVGVQVVDPTRSATEGVAEAAGTGAALGGVMGGGLATGGALANRPQPKQAEPPPLPERAPAEPPPLQLRLPPPESFTADAAGNVQRGNERPQVFAEPEMRFPQGRGMSAPFTPGSARRPTPTVAPAGDITRAADPTAQVVTAPPARFTDAAPGSIADAANMLPSRPAIAPAPAAASQQEAAAQQPAPAPMPAPTSDPAAPDLARRLSPLPWVDGETGEIREPTNDEVKLAIHERMNLQVANGVGINRPTISKSLGLTKPQFDTAWREVKKEREQGLTAPAPVAEQPAAASAPVDLEQRVRDQIQANRQIIRGTDEATPAAQPAAQTEATEPAGGGDSDAVPAAGRTAGVEAVPVAEEPAPDDASSAVSAPEGVEAAPAAAAPPGPAATSYDESPEVLDTDITPPSGGPFSQRAAAEVQARRVEGGRVIDVDGGFVVRTPRADVDASSAEAVDNQAPAADAAQVDAVVASDDATVATPPAPEPAEAPTVEAPPVAEQPATELPPAPQSTPTAAQSGQKPKVRVRAGKAFYDTTHRDTVKAYFEPGRIVAGYSTGRDRVLEFRDDDGTGRWSVKVQAVDKDGNPATENGRPVAPRWHSTAPMDRELRAVFGPATKNPRKVGDAAKPAKSGVEQPKNAAEGSIPAAVAPENAPEVASDAPPAAPATLKDAAHQAATSPKNDLPTPTDAQKEAGNYKKGHIRLSGHDISIENPAGSKRRPEWPALKNHYGYFKGTIGKDKDHVDVFMTDRADDTTLPVFVVDQVNQDGSFDEHKVVMGTATEEEARKTYLANYSKGWTGLGGIKGFTQDEFKAWIRDPAKTKRRVTRTPRAAEKETPAAASSKITDSGEQLRNNNRNRTGGIRWGDVSGLNDTARVAAVHRDAIWPAPDWKAIAREEGVVPWRVLVAKALRSMVPKNPASRGTPTDTDLQAYMDGVQKVQAFAEAYMRNPAPHAFAEDINTPLLRELFPERVAAGRMASWTSFPAERQLLQLLGGNRFLNAAQRARTLPARAMAEVQETGFPNGPEAEKQEAWQRRFEIKHSEHTILHRKAQPGSEAYGHYVTQRVRSGGYVRQRIVAGPFDTEADAIEQARILAKPQKQGESGGLALADVVRTGEPRRPGDVTTDQMREDFGFRGVNFGNWVNQKERQEHLNHAFDAFHDLAAMLGVAPRALSLNGMLGVAFGAQGKGKAAAHFVPGDNEINVTKTAGAGALAHEWAHALDHYFAVQMGPRGARARKPFLSTLLGSTDEKGVRPEVLAAFRDIVQTMRTKPLSDAERAEAKTSYQLRQAMRSDYDRASGALDAEKGRNKQYWATDWEMFARALESWAMHRLKAGDLRSDYLVQQTLESPNWRGAYPLGEEAQRIGAAFDRLFAVLQTEETDDGKVRLFSKAAPTDTPAFRRWFGDSKVVTDGGAPQVVYHGTTADFEEFSADYFGAGDGNADWGDGFYFASNPAAASTYARGEGGNVMPVYLAIRNPAGADVVQEVMDQPGAEMDIDYVRETLAEMGHDGIIIDHGAEGREYVVFRPEQVKSASANSGAFDATDPRLLFSRGGEPASLDFDRALQLKSELTKDWGEAAPAVIVVRTAEDFPDSAKADADYRRAEGFYDGRPTVWLNASTIPSEQRFAQVLAHEAIGHYGIERVVGEKEWGSIVDAIGKLATTGNASEAMLSVLADVRRRYGDLDPSTYASEVLAVMAERGIRNSLLNRVVAAVKRFLRQIMPSTSTWSEDDLRALLGSAESFLRAGRNQEVRQRAVQAYAFSKDIKVDARGERSITMGGEKFVERSGRYYMVNGTGHPKDFQAFEDAWQVAQRTGGEVVRDDPMDGEPQTFSVVVAEDDVRVATAARRFFSKPAGDVLDDIDEVQRGVHAEGTLARARQLLADAVPKKLKDASRPTWLGALTTRHLAELGSDYFSDIKNYSDDLTKMQADRNTLQAEAEGVAERARAWASKNRPAARQLFDLMHESTIDGIDPSESYKPLQFRWAEKLHDATDKNVREAILGIKQQMRERSGDSKKDMLERIKSLNAMRKAEKRRAATYGSMVGKWNELSPEAQQFYRDFRDAYRQRSDAMEEALVKRIQDLKGDGVSEGQIKKMALTIRQQFEDNRLQGVYFPLQRFGRFFVSATKGDDSTFLMFENGNDLERAVKDLRGRGWVIGAQGLKGEAKAKEVPPGSFVADIIGQLHKNGVSEKTQDEVYQIYLQALPELSMRKHQIHRKAIPGFDTDAVRAFAYNMHHGSHQLARLRYSHLLQMTLEKLRKDQDSARRAEGGDTRKILAGDAIIDELGRRHEWIMNPQDSQLTNIISSLGFTYYLGATPAAALVNLTQTALVTYPYLASRHGPIKAMNYLLAASRDAARTLGNIQKTLTSDEERAAHAALMASGALDKTQAHNLAGIAEGGLAGYNPAWAKAMEIIGWGFHKTEVVNREASAMAAFRLSRADGASFNDAVKAAHDAVFDTHFDYSNANRARFMQSGTAKVLLMFRQYSLNMTWTLGRMVWQATKGQTPEVKAIARRNLAGVLGMSALFSGVLGLPTMGVVMGTLNALQSTFGDDDEPWDAETEFRAFLSDLLGPAAAALVARGAANTVTGADIAGRVGLSDLWVRDADRELEGRGLYYHLLEQAAGPMGGVLKNVLVGKAMIDEGHTWRGVETMLPKGLKDVMKAGRYATQGVNTLRGDPLIDDTGLWNTLLQANGFTPAEVADQYERNRALKNYEQHIVDRRQHLMNAFALALRTGDAGARQATMERIQAFNRANPELAITSASISRSIASRARYSARAEAGIVINPKLAARLNAAVAE